MQILLQYLFPFFDKSYRRYQLKRDSPAYVLILYFMPGRHAKLPIPNRYLIHTWKDFSKSGTDRAELKIFNDADVGS